MEPDVYFLVGQNIKKQRKLKKITQRELAEKSYFSYEFIRKIESKSSCRNTFTYTWFSHSKFHKLSTSISLGVFFKIAKTS